MSEIKQQIFITAVLLLALVVLINPFHSFMPSHITYLIVGGVAILFAAYISFVVKEHPQDEREQLHQYIAHRYAYLAGATALVIGIIYEAITMPYINDWLLITLGVVVVAKVASLYHSGKHK